LEPVLIHEYFRILVPAIFFVGLLKLFLPDQLPSDSGGLLLIGIIAGLLIAPVCEKLAKKYFHKQVMTTGFYENFIKSFLRHYGIKTQEEKDGHLTSFSGRLKMPYSPEVDCVLEVYKLFSRQGWGAEEEKYRVRVEKSFGILYFSVFCYATIGFILSVSYPIVHSSLFHPVFRYWFIDAIVLFIVMAVTLSESRSRFRESLKNETLILRGHFRELKESYDRFISVLAEEKLCDTPCDEEVI
jgi:hypothetical protein